MADFRPNSPDFSDPKPAFGQDRIFQKPLYPIPAFQFDSKIAEVFDDMVTRSVPIYAQTHQIILDLVDRLFPDGGTVYDLGCSTGTTMVQIHQHLMRKNKQAQFIGVDASLPMLERSQNKMQEAGIEKLSLRQENIESCKVENADLVIMNYTLQFIAPSKRLAIMQAIYQGLKPGGVLVLSEKLKCPHGAIDDLLIDLYYDFKRSQGYSELEISQKREALENVLIPYTQQEQLALFAQAGFEQYEEVLRWYNFACFVGIKPQNSQH